MLRKTVKAGPLVGALLVVSLASGYAHPAYAGVGIEINAAPPPPLVVETPPPRAGFVWAPGFWRWDGHRHVWAGGHWLRERPGHHWVPDRWTEHGGRYRHEPGRWD